MANLFSKYLKGLFATKGVNPAITNGVINPANQKAINLQVGNYEAAAYTQKRSYIYSAPDSANANPPYGARKEIVRITRYLVKNFSLFERVLSCTETYSVGAGIFPNAATTDTEFNAAATKTFNQWASNPFCSSNNELSLQEMLKVIAREIVATGEVFIVLVKSPLTNYPQLQLASTENVKHSGNSDDKSIDGFYVDDYGKVTAYNIFSGGENYQKVDASNVVHLKRTKYVGQLRGESYFPSCLDSGRDVKDIEDMLKFAVKMQATFAIAVTKKSAEAGVNGVLGNVIPSMEPGNIPTTGYTNTGIEKAYGPIVSYLGENEDIKLLSSDHPTENVMAFIDYLYRKVCMTTGLSYEFLVNPDKLTGTAVRFILSDAQAFFSGMQHIIINSGLNRIYGWVISSLINSGKLPTPKTAGTDIYSVSWTKPASITIDPSRVSNADISLNEAGLQTREAYYSARGRDWRAEGQQWLNEIAYLVDEAKKRNLPIELVLQQYQVGARQVDPGIEQLVSGELETKKESDTVPEQVEEQDAAAA